jgi:peptide-methionine (S)-S-oxide reductase
MVLTRNKTAMPTPETALKGRTETLPTASHHQITGHPLSGPYPAGHEQVLFGMGCFWGAERKFWQQGPGIWITAVGYAGGLTPNPTYEDVCTGLTGHNEVVLVVYDPKVLSFEALLTTFWESHNPTQGLRQGNDVGTQYRSGIYCFTEAQLLAAQASRDAYGRKINTHGFGQITTEVLPAPQFYFADAYHQQYLEKIPSGYCGLRGTGISCAG